MASTELTTQCYQAINLLQEIKAAALETKEYGADWLGSGKTVNRQGGRFAPKNGSQQQVFDIQTEQETIKNEGKNIGKSLSTEDAVKALETTTNQIGLAMKGLTKEERLRLDDLYNNPNVAKANQLALEGVKSVNPEVAKYLKETNDVIMGELKKNRSVTDVLSKAQMHLKDIAKIIKEAPTEDKVAGAVLGTALVLGGVGAIALFSIPNLIGLGGVFGGISAIAQGAAAGEIAQAFAVGGLSQLGFSLSAYAALNGAWAILQNIKMLEQTRFEQMVAPIGNKVAMDLGEKMAWQEKEDKKKSK